MSQIKHQEYILEAIDQLRRRKARPDSSRICSYLFRHYTVGCNETRAALEKLVDNEIVIKVDYKGQASYRNASKWTMLNSYKSKQEHEFDLSALVCKTVAELCLLEPDYLDHGVPFVVIEKQIYRKDRRFTKELLESVLDQELRVGTLIKMQNNNFFVGEHQKEPLFSDLSDHNDTFSPMSSPNPSIKSLDSTPASLPKKVKSHKKKKVVRTDKIDEPFSESPCPPLEIPPVFPDKSVESPKVTDLVEKVASAMKSKAPKREVASNPESKNNSDNEETGNSKDSSDSKDNVPIGSLDKKDLSVNGRRKRSKKVVFDPSDNNLPKPKKQKKGRPPVVLPPKQSPPSVKNLSPIKQVRKSSCDSVEKVKKVDQSNTSSIFQPVCGICDCTEKRVKGVLDSFISCTDCITKVHLKCFENTKATGSILKVDVNNWQCSNCKTCSICEDATEMDKLITCFACDEAFHPECHDTISNCKTKLSRDSDKWFCSNCFQENMLLGKLNVEEEKPNLNSVKPSVVKPDPVFNSQPPVNCSQGDHVDVEFTDQKLPLTLESCFTDPFESFPVDESIPDASKWSSEEVYKYFVKFFQPSIAEIFKKQEIDGLSLLLMKRCDILKGFNLKLGPALKVYGHVKRLQIRRTAPQLLWT